MKKNKVLTLGLIFDKKKILLGYKKRGFGLGRFNGFGGKLNPGESILNAAKREILEESGLSVDDLEKRGVLIFKFKGVPEVLEVNVFSTSIFQGDPIETEEMRPQWFNFDQIPYSKMWPDDKFWLPLIIEGKNVSGTFNFLNENELLNHKIRIEEKI